MLDRGFRPDGTSGWSLCLDLSLKRLDDLRVVIRELLRFMLPVTFLGGEERVFRFPAKPPCRFRPSIPADA